MDNTPILRFSNDGTPLGLLEYDEATHEENLDGTDKLTVITSTDVAKRERLVWQDGSGEWHEHMVDSTSRSHSGRARSTVICSNSISELYGVIATGNAYRLKVGQMLPYMLAYTRWTTGDCSDFGIVELEVWHKNVRQCLQELCDIVGGELVTKISVDNRGVYARSVAIVRERGAKSVYRQFTYGRNVSGVSRDVDAAEVYTAVRGYGAKLDPESIQTYPERLTVEVKSSLNLNTWGVRDNSGNMAHNWTTYTDANCTDGDFLVKQCRAVLASVSKPLVHYRFDIAQVDEALWRDVRLGDVVMCVDDTFNPAFELRERVSGIQRKLSGRIGCVVEIGKRANPLTESFKSADKATRQLLGNGLRGSYSSPYTSGVFPGDFGTGEVTQPAQPASIAVLIPPTRLRYMAGENLSFTGIAVAMFDENGELFTSDSYPDGIIPFNQLMFPVTVCPEGDGSGIVTPEYDGSSTMEITSIASIRSALEAAISHSANGYVRDEGFAALLALVDQYEGHAAWVDVFISSDSFHGGSPIDIYIAPSYSIGDSINLGHYAQAPVTSIGCYGDKRSGEPCKISRVWSHTGNIGYMTFVGERENGSSYFVSNINAKNSIGSATIPVKWPSSSGQILETSFTVIVEDAPETIAEPANAEIPNPWGDPSILYPELYE